MKVIIALCASIIVAVLAVTPAHAQRSTQLSPDEVTVLVNKRLGQQQWAIVVDLDAQTAIGNVFNLDGNNPQFIWCEILEPFVLDQEDFIGATVQLDCFAALGCAALPCDADAWQPAGTPSIPGSFFLP